MYVLDTFSRIETASTSFTYVLCAPSFPGHFILIELNKLRKNALLDLHTLVSTDSSFSYRILL
jgi:hypothetical protein